MKIFVVIFSLLSGAMAHAAPLEGFWLGPVDEDGNRSTIQMYPCGDKFCGKVTAVTLPTSEFLLGQVILLDLEQQSPFRYTNGLIRFDHLRWTFTGSIAMDDNDTATLRGCWARVICQNVPYVRVAG